MTKVAVAKAWPALYTWSDGTKRSNQEPEVTPNVWYAVTPPEVSLDPDYAGPGDGGNYGFESVCKDPSNPGHVYAMCHLQGIWKSTDYGKTYVGPINTGTNGAAITASAGCITVIPTGGVPVLAVNIGRGNLGYYNSTDGGVNWLKPDISPPMPDGREDIYPVSFNPYNGDDQLSTGHEQNKIIRSRDGGVTFENVNMPTETTDGSGYIFHIDMGNEEDTAETWLWIAQGTGGTDGTWRTGDGGETWTKVDKNEHQHGGCQIYQPGSGVIWMCGVYSDLGWGNLRSADYGVTWTHYGPNEASTIIWGTPTRVYSMGGFATHDPVSPGFKSCEANTPATWTDRSDEAPETFLGGAAMVAVMNDGENYIFIMAVGNSGLSRYVEAL
jgi:hypothetical protein